jgi:cobalt-zinc-cadmium efflux system outer membrane protein
MRLWHQAARQLLLVVLWTAGRAEARADDIRTPRRLSAGEFLALVEQANPRLEVLAARVHEARAERTAAAVAANPTLSYDREDVLGMDERPEDFLRLSVPLDVSRRRSRRVEAADAAARAVEAEAGLQRVHAILDALDVYYQAAHLRLRVEALREGRTVLAKAVEAVHARAGAGDASGYDAERLELELGTYDEQLQSADAELAATRRALGRLVGDPAGLYEAGDGLAIPAPPVREVLADPNQRGDYRAARLREQQGAAILSAGRRGWVPALELTGGVKTVGLGHDAATGYLVGMALELPIFDHGQGERALGGAIRRRAAAEIRLLEVELPSLVEAATDDLRRRIEQARSFEDGQVARAGSLVRKAEVSYREGDRPILDLLDAYRTAREVRLRALELRLIAKRSELALWRALGRRP